MQMENNQQSGDNLWEIDRMMAKLSKRKQLIELLKVYNEQDQKRLMELISNN
jgi:hypothetical protein